MTVTGCTGQVARALGERGAHHRIAVQAMGRPTLDLLRPGTVVRALRATSPDVIVNAAAYTAVDAAESAADLAFAVNAAGAEAVAAAAAAIGVPMIQLSTDYVFDGLGPRPYREEDPVAPLGIYGRSKRAGEEAVATASPNHVVLRTSWVYGEIGSNFVKTMLRLAADRDTVSVVDDQRGCPTAALDLADGILAVARALIEHPAPSLRGLFHMAGPTDTTWADFATAVFALSAARGGPSARVTRVPTTAYPTPARRPANSRLDGTKLANTFGIVLPGWERSLPGCVAALVERAP